jgi:hypothetical protein
VWLVRAGSTGRVWAVAAVGSAAVLVGCLGGAEPDKATLADPHGCAVDDEGPAALYRPTEGRPEQLAVILRTQFQTALSTETSPDAAVARDPSVLKRLRVRQGPNGLTYTEFQAVRVGRTVVTAERRERPDGPTTILRLVVRVVCDSDEIRVPE